MGYLLFSLLISTLGTFDEGTVRISPGWYNTAAEMLLAADILQGLGR